MALKEQIQQEMKAAMLSGDRFVGDVLRNLKAAILNEEVAEGKRETGLSDEEIERVIAREVKKRAESASLYRNNGRDDLADPEERESAVLRRFLPEQVDEETIRNAVKSSIEKLDLSGPAAMGQVIGSVKAQFGNTADGATIARITREQLSK